MFNPSSQHFQSIFNLKSEILNLQSTAYNLPMPKSTVHATCPHDCPDACGVLITVEDGRATRIQGDPAHPVTRGFLCAKVARYLDRVYSPDRLLYPLRRVAPKGEGAGTLADFERITWDEALDQIAATFKKIVQNEGPEAILPYSYGGTLGALNGSAMDHRFFHRLGASQLDRTICSTPGEMGVRSVYGAKLGTEPEQFRHSKYIIAWGANIHGNNVHLWPFIEEARRNGAKLVVIDPYQTRTARCADWHLAINPGTDVALALGLMHVIINESLYDAHYVSRHTVGFEQLRIRVQQYPPEKVAQWTGIPADDIRRLAREYAETRPAAIRLNYGIQRCENGGSATRAVCMLPCLTGSWKEVGGGLQMSLSDAFMLNKDALKRPGLMPKIPCGDGSSTRPPRTINMVELGQALTEVNDPPVKALFVFNSNPAAVVPDRNRTLQGLRRRDLFTVVHDQFLTDTCDYADLVLPATTFFEHKDLVASYGHYYLQVSQPAIAPLGECRSNVEMFRALALRMGFEDACFQESDDEMIDAALAAPNPWLRDITRERLEREGQVRLNFAAATTAAAATASATNSKVAVLGGSSLPRQSSTPVILSERDRAEGEGARAKDPYLHDHVEVGSRSDSRATRDSRAAVEARGFSPATQPNQSNGALAPEDFFLPFAHGHFPTKSGKAEFYSASLAAQGLDPVVAFVPPSESRHNAERRYPLEMLARKADNFLNSTFCNLPVTQKMEEEHSGLLEMHARDATQRGIVDGDRVRVFNARGDILLKAHVNGAVQPGVVSARLHWAKLNGGKNLNVLTSTRLTDFGGGPTFYSCLVEVERAGD